MAELERQENGTWKWKGFTENAEYYLGMHHGNGIGISGDDVYGFYLGMRKGRHRFISKENGSLHSHSCGVENNIAVWISDGEEDMGAPSVKTVHDGKLPEDLAERVAEILNIEK